MFGPDAEQLRFDVDIVRPHYTVDYVRESDALAFRFADHACTVDDFAVFIPFQDKVARHGNLLFTTEANGAALSVRDASTGQDGAVVAVVDMTALLVSKAIAPALPRPTEPRLSPPSFGVTFLGTSHGLDARGRCTSLLLWINSRGVLVDPNLETSFRT
jgi:hypothetical protein